MVNFSLNSVVHGDENVTVNIDDGDTPNILGYVIFYSGKDNGNVKSKNTKTFSTVVTGLTNGTEYSFQVTKLKSDGMSEDSEPIVATPSGIPNTSIIVEGNMPVSTIREIVVKWNKFDSSNGNLITSFTINLIQDGDHLLHDRVLTVADIAETDGFEIDDDKYVYTITDFNADEHAPALSYGLVYIASVSATNANGSGIDYSTANILKTTKPDAPSNFNVSIDENTNTSVNLTWDAYTADTNGGLTVTSNYIVVKNNADDVVFVDGFTSITNPPSYIVTGMSDIKNLTFHLTASNDYDSSDVASATISPDAAPHDVADLTASNTDGGVDLSWAYAGDDETSPLIGYVVFYKVDNMITEYTSTKSISITGLEIGTSITFYVVAVNSLGQSVNSVSTTIEIKGVPTFNSDVLVGTGAEDLQTKLTWSAPLDNGSSAILGYKIYRSYNAHIKDFIDDVNHLHSEYLISDLQNGNTYKYYITAYNAIGESEPSNTVEVIPSKVPTVTLSATKGNNSVDLSWSVDRLANGADSTFDIHMKVSTEDTYILIDSELTEVVKTYTNDNNTLITFVNGTIYDVKIVANNVSGNGEDIKQFTPSTDPSIPTDVNGVKNVNEGTYKITWGSPINDGGLDVLYRIRLFEGLYNSINREKILDTDDNDGVTANEYTFTNLTLNQQYSYTLSAYNTVDTDNADDDVNSIITNFILDGVSEPPTVPTNVKYSYDPPTALLTVTWGSPQSFMGSVKYNIALYDTLNATSTNIPRDSITDETDVYYIFHNVTPNLDYSIRLYAYTSTDAASDTIVLNTPCNPQT